MDRQNVYTGAPWEKRVAYCRAKRVGRLVFVSGTVAASPDGQVIGPGDAYLQSRHILQIIEGALAECGASLRDVVRTRMFVTDIGQFEGVARAHREAFTGIDPVTTCVEVVRLVSPEYLVEIEADAVIEPQ